MPYIEKQPAIGDTTTDNDVLTRGEAKVLIEKLLSNSLFHELEPVEVLDVYVNPKDSAFDHFETFGTTFFGTTVPEDIVGEPIQVIAPIGHKNADEDISHFDADGTVSKSYAREKSLLGAIRGRYVVSQQGDNIEQTKIFRPLDPNIIQYPLIGEIVLGLEFNGEFYYFSKLNNTGKVSQLSQYGLSNINDELANVSDKVLTNSVLVENRKHSFSTISGSNIPLGLNFEEDQRVFRLRPEEGDTIIQGRYGQSIRLGSNVRRNREGGEGATFTSSPNIKLVAGCLMYDRAGEVHREVTRERGGGGDSEVVGYRDEYDIRSHTEDLNLDETSLYLTTNEVVTLPEPALTIGKRKISSDYRGPQAILASERIIINAKPKLQPDDVTGDTKSQVSILSNDEIILEVPRGKVTDGVGSNDFTSLMGNSIRMGAKIGGLDPVVKGNSDFSRVIDIVLNTQISANLAAIATETALPTPNVQRINALVQENGELERIKSTKSFYSKTVNTE